MADFVAVLKKTIDGLGDNTPAMREKVYQKARSTVAAKLAAINPPPPAAVAERQKRVLDEAIAEVESSYADGADDPFAELENVFADPVKKADQPVAARRRRCLQDPMSNRSRGRVALLSRIRPSKRWPSRGRACRSTASEDEDDEGEYEPMRRRRNFAPLIAAVVALAVLAGGGYAVWLNRDDFKAMLGIGGGQTLTSAPARQRSDGAGSSEEDRQRCGCGRRGRRKIHAAAEQRRLGGRSQARPAASPRSAKARRSPR